MGHGPSGLIEGKSLSRSVPFPIFFNNNNNNKNYGLHTSYFVSCEPLCTLYMKIYTMKNIIKSKCIILSVVLMCIAVEYNLNISSIYNSQLNVYNVAIPTEFTYSNLTSRWTLRPLISMFLNSGKPWNRFRYRNNLAGISRMQKLRSHSFELRPFRGDKES